MNVSEFKASNEWNQLSLFAREIFSDAVRISEDWPPKEQAWLLKAIAGLCLYDQQLDTAKSGYDRGEIELIDLLRAGYQSFKKSLSSVQEVRS